MFILLYTFIYLNKMVLLKKCTSGDNINFSSICTNYYHIVIEYG